MSNYSHIKIPAAGEKITVHAGRLQVPDQPLVPFIEGDGIGVDITPVMRRVVDAAVQKVYGGKRQIHWMEIYAGEKATQVYGENEWLPAETLEALKEFVVSIKGPLTTPVGGGIRSPECGVAPGAGSVYLLAASALFCRRAQSAERSSKTDMVIFRENSEDIYAGIEWAADSPGAGKVIRFCRMTCRLKRSVFPSIVASGSSPFQRLARPVW